MFKNIKATFKIVDNSKNPRLSLENEFEVERYESGATHYGDHSAHKLSITNAPETMPHYYDTRYEGISPEKSEWLTFWKSYIEEEWLVKIELTNYKEDYDN